MTISAKDWYNYITKLSALNEKAAAEMRAYVSQNGYGDMNSVIDYAYALVTKYGEGAGALSAAMYDAVAEMAGKTFDPAEMAETPDYQEVAKTVQGVAKQSKNADMMGNAVGRLVKRTGADTTLKNALRDGAEFAWVPSGDTCSFCITLASRGWQRASKAAIKGGHAEHIHGNCDCTYAIRFDGKSNVAGYDPDRYLAMYENAEGGTPQEKINAMRRENYAENREKINAQKRAAYAERKAGEKTLISKSETPKNETKKESEKDNTPSDVTMEYYLSAKPGNGSVTYQDNYDMGQRHEEERKAAQWIHDTLGDDVTLLTETNGQREKTPDFLWREKNWDWKTVSTEKAANSAVRHGLQQIKNNPGGIMLDYKNNNIEIDKVVDVINERMKWNRTTTADILIIQDQRLKKVLRYNEK